MREISFFVPGLLKPKERPRFGKHGVYTPRSTKSSEQIIALQAKLAMRGQDIFTGYVVLHINVIFHPPESWSKKKTKAAMAGDLMPTKNDWDNLGKICSDAMNGIVYGDDRQVIKGIVTKSYGEKDITYIRAIEINNARELELCQ